VRAFGGPLVAWGRLPFTSVPRFWIWMQVLVVLFVVAGMVIAITRLA
jgi:hypothetical protein